MPKLTGRALAQARARMKKAHKARAAKAKGHSKGFSSGVDGGDLTDWESAYGWAPWSTGGLVRGDGGDRVW